METPAVKNVQDLNTLARERTSLANERTFLSYVRTAIMLVASGVTVIKVMGSGHVPALSGAALCLAGFAVGLTGLVRFRAVRDRLR